MKFLHLVWSNLKRKKLRTSLTLLSILVAFVLFSLLSALKLALAADRAALLRTRHQEKRTGRLPPQAEG